MSEPRPSPERPSLEDARRIDLRALVRLDRRTRGEAWRQGLVSAGLMLDLDGRDLDGRDLDGRDLDGRDLGGQALHARGDDADPVVWIGHLRALAHQAVELDEQIWGLQSLEPAFLNHMPRWGWLVIPAVILLSYLLGSIPEDDIEGFFVFGMVYVIAGLLAALVVGLAYVGRRDAIRQRDRALELARARRQNVGLDLEEGLARTLARDFVVWTGDQWFVHLPRLQWLEDRRRELLGWDESLAAAALTAQGASGQARAEAAPAGSRSNLRWSVYQSMNHSIELLQDRLAAHLGQGLGGRSWTDLGLSPDLSLLDRDLRDLGVPREAPILPAVDAHLVEPIEPPGAAAHAAAPAPPSRAERARKPSPDRDPNARP